MEGRRKQIIDAGLSLLKLEGLSGLTQPRVCALTGLRQSHLTYYYPTRSALVIAVADAAIAAQIEASGESNSSIEFAETAAQIFSCRIMDNDNTRVLLALSEAADQETALQGKMIDFIDSSRTGLMALLKRLGLDSTGYSGDLLQALCVGLAVIQFASRRSNGVEISKQTLEAALRFLTQPSVREE